MDNSYISLRNADINDADLLYGWANDMDVRMSAFTKEDFSYDDHLSWYKEKLKNPYSHIFIGFLPLDDEGIEDIEYLTPQRGDYLPGGGCRVSTPDDGAPVNSCLNLELADALGMPGADSISRLRIKKERAVGQIRLDIDGDCAEIDYSVDAGSRGKGYGTQLLLGALDIQDERIKTFVARVKKKNTASIKAFESAGFEVAGEGEKNGFPYIKFVKDKEDHQKRDGAIRRILICTIKHWNIRNAQLFANRYSGIYDIHVITDMEALSKEAVDDIAPDVVFFPHWSAKIPAEIFEKYECIAFHMSDLPFGRGGSPLQNLVARGFKETKISALRVSEGFDTGPVYMKSPLSLEGTATQIYTRCSDIIFSGMIPYILKNRPEPVKQQGEATVFARRKKEDGRITADMDLEKIYDYIRMLDAEGYPDAFIELSDDVVLEFDEAEYDKEACEVRARVVFKKNKK